MSNEINGGKPNEKQPSKSWALFPTLSLYLPFLHLWMGRQHSQGRWVYVLVEESEKSYISFTLFWLSNERPMFSLILWPFPIAHIFWLHSSSITEE